MFAKIFMNFVQTGTTITDQMDLLREQMKMLAGEVALCTSSLKRMSEQAANNPDNYQLKVILHNFKTSTNLIRIHNYWFFCKIIKFLS